MPLAGRMGTVSPGGPPAPQLLAQSSKSKLFLGCHQLDWAVSHFSPVGMTP